jgi:hypothetical protein
MMIKPCPAASDATEGSIVRMRNLLLLALCIVQLAAFWKFALPPRPDGINEATVQRIQKGMRRREVEEILGGPPGDYRTIPTEDLKGGPGMFGDVDRIAALNAIEEKYDDDCKGGGG